MKLVTFKVHTEERIDALFDGKIVDLNSAYTIMLKESCHLGEKQSLAPTVHDRVPGGRR